MVKRHALDASYSGSEDAVRLLLNCAGIDVESPSYPSGYIPLHLACLSGHIGVVGLLLSRSTELLKVRERSENIKVLGLIGKKDD